MLRKNSISFPGVNCLLTRSFLAGLNHYVFLLEISLSYYSDVSVSERNWRRWRVLVFFRPSYVRYCVQIWVCYTCHFSHFNFRPFIYLLASFTVFTFTQIPASTSLIEHLPQPNNSLNMRMHILLMFSQILTINKLFEISNILWSVSNSFTFLFACNDIFNTLPIQKHI